MSIEFYFVVVCILMLFAVLDIIVGVSNDAANFLNSSIGSRVAPHFVIMSIASLGILAGVTFSSGMMEVARKGIFHPQFFTMPELITIFMAVMMADILLLDLFNTYGLPTSTTVSIVFELLGAAVAASLIKVMQAGDGAMGLADYINTSKAMVIVFGILLSIVVAFFSGAVVQFFTRLVFTFDYQQRLKRYGAIWGGIALVIITFFILIKGAKGASFVSADAESWIRSHTLLILSATFLGSAAVFQLLTLIFQINILKPIVLIGTFALAMAFAANDLVNFIGVPLAGLQAYKTAALSSDPLTATMGALGKQVQSQTHLLLIAGAVMVITLWLSRKARTVSETEIHLSQQEEGVERFESIWLSRTIVGMVDSSIQSVKSFVPRELRRIIRNRIDPQYYKAPVVQEDKPSYDLLRASVNLMVASAVVSFATSLKLPLSTTYITFMVAMGTSFSDHAWGRESAVYRVTGVLTVIGGWFLTAFIAFIISFAFAYIIHELELSGIALLMVFLVAVIWRNHKQHRIREKAKEDTRIFALDVVDDCRAAVFNTFEHLALLIKEIRESLDEAFDGLFTQDMYKLDRQRKKTKQIQLWVNVIISNIFNVLRILQQQDHRISYNYYQIIRRLQKLSDGYRDIVARSHVHVSNKHSGLLREQIDELSVMKTNLFDILGVVETSFSNKQIANYGNIIEKYQQIRNLSDECNKNQVERIISDASKTRLSVLYYAILGNCIMITKQHLKLIQIFNETFRPDEQESAAPHDAEPGNILP